jgi:DNA-binding GntR family transcriptional regulator
MGALKPLKVDISLDKLAYDRIKDAILTFQFMPGEILIEGELATQLGISKTPVRDALIWLEKEGLVTRIPFKGTHVTDINNQDMVNFLEIRTVLEGLAIRHATELLSDTDIEKLEKLIDKQHQALNKKDYAAVSKINTEFHGLILQKCNNPHLLKTLEALDDLLKRYRLLSIVQGLGFEKAIPEHKSIIAALKNRDPLEAEKAMKEHLMSAMNDLNSQDLTKLEYILAKKSP